jgi:alcohol dehydrogenase class IV
MVSKLTDNMWEKRLQTQIARLLGRFFKDNSSPKILVVSGKNTFQALGGHRFIQLTSPKSEISVWSYTGRFVTVAESKKLIEYISDSEPDVLIGLGGGVAMDFTKVAAGSTSGVASLLEAQDETIWRTPQNFKIPLILVPTLFGSGAESTRHAVIYRGLDKYSMQFNASQKMQKILVPELADSARRIDRLFSGLDAVCQGVETSWSKNASRESAKNALSGLRKVIAGFDDYVDGRNTQARDFFVHGSSSIGEAMNVGKTTAPHAFSYFLSSRFGTPHGHAVSVLLRAFWLQMNSSDYLMGASKDLVLKLSEIRNAVNLDGQNTDELGAWIYDRLEKNGLETNVRDLLTKHNFRSSEFLNAVNVERVQNHPTDLSTLNLYDVFNLEFS